MCSSYHKFKTFQNCQGKKERKKKISTFNNDILSFCLRFNISVLYYLEISAHLADLKQLVSAPFAGLLPSLFQAQDLANIGGKLLCTLKKKVFLELG